MEIKTNDVITIDYDVHSNDPFPLFWETGQQIIVDIKDDDGKFYSASGITIRTDKNEVFFDIAWVRTLNGKPFNAFPEHSSDWKRPKWKEGHKCHNWKNYISQEIQEHWSIFSDHQKRMLINQAQEMANREEWE